MFIQDFNCSWLNHPFFGSSMILKNRQQIDKVVRFGIRELFIDTDKGRDVEGETLPVDDISEEKTTEAASQDAVKEAAKQKQHTARSVTVNEEIGKARKIKDKTIKMIHKIMSDVKLGKQVEKGAAEDIVNDIVDSVFRNQDALIGLGRLRKINDYVYNHSMSVCVLMVSFGKYLGYNPDLLREVGIGAMLHDIGTAYVPQEILNKATELTDAEFKQIKLHVEFGNTLLKQAGNISTTAFMTVYQHHERMDIHNFCSDS